MVQNNIKHSSTAATNMAPQLFSISFCNIRGLSSNISPVHHHLQPINPYALFLTETKIKLLYPSKSTVLSPHLKCHGCKSFASFYRNGGVCAFIIMIIMIMMKISIILGRKPIQQCRFTRGRQGATLVC